MVHLRPSAWADLDPIEKHTTLLDGLRATTACFSESALHEFCCGSEAEACWYGMCTSYWLRHLLAMQNMYARERSRYFKCHRQGYNYIGNFQQQPYERVIDPMLTANVVLQYPDMSDDTNTDGRRVVHISVPNKITGVHERSLAMMTFAGVLTQLYVFGNCVQLYSQNTTGTALVRYLLSHLIDHYECLEIVEKNEQAPTGLFLGKTMQNSWVLLPETWLVLPGVQIHARVARLLHENDARIVFYDPAYKQSHIDPIISEIQKKTISSKGVTEIQWLPQDDLISVWPQVVLTHCASILVGHVHERSFRFKQQLYEHVEGNDTIPRREHDPINYTASPNERSIRGSRRERSSRSASAAATKVGLGLPLEEVRPASVVGINCSALDVLHCYPQLPFVEGRVGNSFRLKKPLRSVVRRPFNSFTWFDGVGGGGWSARAAGSHTIASESRLLCQERLAHYLRDTKSLRSLLPFLVSRYLRF